MWTCDPGGSFGGEFYFSAWTKSQGSAFSDDLILSTICKAGNTGDSSLEYSGGDMYLDISADGPWTITIQEFK